MKQKSVIVDFEAAITDGLLDPHIRDGISSIVCTGKYLWAAGDENISIQRMERLDDGSYGKAKNFFLKELIDLPALDEEADIEGMEVAGNYLWIIGSHSYKRKKAREEKDNPLKEMDRLGKTELGANRNLLARIPIIKDKAGEVILVKEAPDPANPGRTLRAAKLKHSKKKWSQLTRMLKEDKHIGSFIGIPGKDNGFDIEGLTVFGDKIFLGLRGPVLRGWAVILEIQLEDDQDNLLRLKKDPITGEYFRKHFLNLYGMGIRELARQEQDIIILAGPTMDLDGIMEIYRWKNGCLHDSHQLVKRQELESVFVFPQEGKVHNRDKAEGLALREDNELLIAYDSPREERKLGEFKVALDTIEI